MRYHAKRLDRLTKHVFIKEEELYRRVGQQEWITDREFERLVAGHIFGVEYPQYGD